jgi:prolyl 4-hydroxylase
MNPELQHAYDLWSAERQDEALPIIRRLADQGDSDALFTLGDMYWCGMGLPQQLDTGRELFRRASDAGNPAAIRAYTNLLASGIAGPRDWPAAIARLRHEARHDGRRAAMLAVIDAMDLTPDGDPREPPQGEMISRSPIIVHYSALFSAQECAFLLMVAEPGYTRSLVGHDGTPLVRDEVRTSDGATIHPLIEDPAIHALNRRIAMASDTHVTQGEPLQLLRYQPGQQYRNHLDFQRGPNPRIRTALVYLNDAYRGGETRFPRIGLDVKGNPGDAIVFQNAIGDRADLMSEHAGLPVESGTKYLASRWLRARQWTV